MLDESNVFSRRLSHLFTNMNQPNFLQFSALRNFVRNIEIQRSTLESMYIYIIYLCDTKVLQNAWLKLRFWMNLWTIKILWGVPFYTCATSKAKSKKWNWQQIFGNKTIRNMWWPPRYDLLDLSKNLNKLAFAFHMVWKRCVCTFFQRKLNFATNCEEHFCFFSWM